MLFLMRYSFFRPKRRLHSGYNKQLYCRSSSETLRREHIGSRGIPRILRTLEKIPKGRPRNWAEDGFILEATTAVDLCRNKIPELGYNPPTSALLQPAIIAEFSEKGSINGSVKVLLESSECERGCAVFAFIMMHCERVSWLTREAKYYPQTKLSLWLLLYPREQLPGQHETCRKMLQHCRKKRSLDALH